jgi:predicted CoA-binding protein
MLGHNRLAHDLDIQALSEADNIKLILKNAKTIAVVGLSPKTHRDSYGVSLIMQQAGYKIIPINPNASEILGEPVFTSLREAAKVHTIDLVNVFRNSEDVPPVIDEAIAIHAPAVWLQLGISHAAALEKAKNAGLLTVQNKCLKVEWRRYS